MGRPVDLGSGGARNAALLSPLTPLLGAVNFSPDVQAFMGGLGVGLVVFFVSLLLTLGAGVIRRMLD
jgi:hypothetical protein